MITNEYLNILGRFFDKKTALDMPQVCRTMSTMSRVGKVDPILNLGAIGLQRYKRMRFMDDRFAKALDKLYAGFFLDISCPFKKSGKNH